MSDDILNLQPLHPFKAINSNISTNTRYSAIDSHSGLLVSVADKEIYFYDTNTYEELSINSNLRRDKSIDIDKSFSINCDFEVSWVEFNCNASCLLIATLSNVNHLNNIKIIDVAKTISEKKEIVVCTFTPNIDSELVDLKWHPSENDCLLLVLNDSVNICRVKESEFVIMHSKPDAFCVSWSPKGKQFSVVMKKVGSRNFVVNQYDINFVEKRSTEIPDPTNDFNVSFDLIPIEICWYSTYSVIIGFRGNTPGKERFQIFVCRLAIKTCKIQVLSDLRSSSDCINPNPGPCARLYYLHIPDWKSIVLVNNSAEDAVVVEYDSNDDLHTITTYCLPLEGNVIGLSCDYTSNKTIPDSWLPPGFEPSGSYPLLFVKLTNADCFGIYMLHSEKKMPNNYNKMLVNSISSEKGDLNRNNSIDQSQIESNSQSNVSKGYNQNSFLSQQVTDLENIKDIEPISSPITYGNQNANEMTSQIKKPISHINIFGTLNSNIPASQSNIFTTQNIDKSIQKSNLFGTLHSNTTASQSNIFGTQNIDKPPQKSNLFGTPSTESPATQSNIFGTQNIDKPPQKSNLFGTQSTESPASQSNIFGTQNIDKPPQKNNLFGTPSTESPATQSNIFGTQNIDKPPQKSNLFGTQSTESPATQSNIFGTQNIDKPPQKSNLFGTQSTESPATQSNIFGTQNIDKPPQKSNLFGTQSTESPASQSNIFGTQNIDKPPQKNNLFGTPSTESPATQSNIFGTQNVDKPPQKSNLFGTQSTESPATQSNIFGTQNIDKPPQKNNLFGTQSTESPASQSNIFGTQNIDKPPQKSNLFGTQSTESPATQSNIFGTQNIEKSTPQTNLFGNTNNTTQPSIFSSQKSELSTSQSPLTSIQNQNKSNNQFVTQNKESAQHATSKPIEIGIQNSVRSNVNVLGNTNQNSSKTTIEFPAAKGIFSDQDKNTLQTSISNTNTATNLSENKSSASNKNLQKSNLEDHDKQSIKKENISTRQLIKISKNKTDNKGDMIDNFLPNAIDCLEKQINDIKMNTENVISKSRKFLDNSEINKEISKMFHDLEKNFIDVNKVNMNNNKIIENSKSLCQDIEITLEFTTRFQEAILDSKINHKNFRPAPNPLLKKTSLNLDTLFKKVGFHLKDLEEALDYVETKKNYKVTLTNKKMQFENIKQTLKSNEKVIKLERSKLHLINENIHDSSIEAIEFPNSHLQTRYVNTEMEKHLHALMCRRPVNNISCKLPETKQPVKSKKTPIKHNYITTKPAAEPIKSELKEPISKPPIVKLVEKDSYKYNQNSNINHETSINSIESSSGNVTANKHTPVQTSNSSLKEIIPKVEYLNPENSKHQEIDSIKINESKSKSAAPTTTVNDDSSSKSFTISNSKDSGIFDESNSKTIPIANSTLTTPTTDILQAPTNTGPFFTKITQSGNESFTRTISSKTPEIIQPNPNNKSNEDLPKNPNKTPQSNDTLSTFSATNIQPSPVVSISITSINSTDNAKFTGVFSSSAFTPSNSATGLFNIAPLIKPDSGLISNSNTSQSIFSTPKSSKQQNSNVTAVNNPTTQSTALFGTTSSTKSNLFDKSNIFPSSSSVSSAQITTTTVQPTELINTPTSSKQTSGLFGNANSEKNSIFSTPTTVQSIFNAHTSTKPNIGFFGNSNVSTQNTNLFAAAPSITSSTAQSTGILTTSESNKSSLFGSSNTPISTQPHSGLFGNPSGSIQSVGLFGTTNSNVSTASIPISCNSLFGNSTANNQQASTGLFGGAVKSQTTGLFSTPVSKSSQNGSLFGTGTNTSSSGLFGSSTQSQATDSTNQSSGGLFRNANQQSTGIFPSANNSLFGNATTSPTSATGLFAQSNTGNNIFGTPKPANQTVSGGNGLFGSSSNSSMTGTGIFGTPSTNVNTSEGLFGNKSSTSPSAGFFGKNAQAPNSGLFNSSNQNNQPPPSNIFGTSSPQSTLFSSNKMGTQQENSTGFSFGSNTMMSGLGSTQPSNNSKNIFGLATATGNTTASVNLFAPKTQSNTSNIFNNDSKPSSLFGNNVPFSQTSHFGSRAIFGSGNENNAPSGGLFSNSVFGNNSDSQMTFGDMATNNVSQSGFGMNSNQPGNIFQTTTSPSFTQRRM